MTLPFIGLMSSSDCQLLLPGGSGWLMQVAFWAMAAAWRGESAWFCTGSPLTWCCCSWLVAVASVPPSARCGCGVLVWGLLLLGEAAVAPACFPSPAAGRAAGGPVLVGGSSSQAGR